MPEKRICKECGAEIPPDAPQGLCLHCLARVALSFAKSPHSPVSPRERILYFGDYEIDGLCRFYRRPIFAFFQRVQAYGAEDLTQGFFAHLLNDAFLSADRSKGKFRLYLLIRLKHFLANRRRRSKAQKRGGNVAFVSLDAESDEKKCLQVAAPNPTPDQVFLQQWARTLLESTLDSLRSQHHAEGKGALFEELKGYMTRNDDHHAAQCAELAKKLGKTEAALKMATLRMTKEWEELLYAEIAKTVTSPMEVEHELRALFGAFNS
jgi:RNA polymerase sigma-70 factor (ECF subfamily)